MGMGLPPSSFPIAVCQPSSAPGRPIPVTPLVSRERERERERVLILKQHSSLMDDDNDERQGRQLRRQCPEVSKSRAE